MTAVRWEVTRYGVRGSFPGCIVSIERTREGYELTANAEIHRHPFPAGRSSYVSFVIWRRTMAAAKLAGPWVAAECARLRRVGLITQRRIERGVLDCPSEPDNSPLARERRVAAWKAGT